MDPEDHKKYIGVDNSLILENLKKLSDEGAGLYIRLPIIQQVNATDEHIESVIHFRKKTIFTRQVNLYLIMTSERVNTPASTWSTMMMR